MSLPPEAYENVEQLIADCLAFVLSGGQIDSGDGLYNSVGSRSGAWLRAYDGAYSMGSMQLRDDMLLYPNSWCDPVIEGLQARLDRIIFLTQGGNSEPVPSEQASADGVQPPAPCSVGGSIGGGGAS